MPGWWSSSLARRQGSATETSQAGSLLVFRKIQFSSRVWNLHSHTMEAEFKEILSSPNTQEPTGMNFRISPALFINAKLPDNRDSVP